MEVSNGTSGELGISDIHRLRPNSKICSNAIIVPECTRGGVSIRKKSPRGGRL